MIIFVGLESFIYIFIQSFLFIFIESFLAEFVVFCRTALFRGYPRGTNLPCTPIVISNTTDEDGTTRILYRMFTGFVPINKPLYYEEVYNKEGKIRAKI